MDLLNAMLWKHLKLELSSVGSITHQTFIEHISCLGHVEMTAAFPIQQLITLMEAEDLLTFSLSNTSSAPILPHLHCGSCCGQNHSIYKILI